MTFLCSVNVVPAVLLCTGRYHKLLYSTYVTRNIYDDIGQQMALEERSERELVPLESNQRRVFILVDRSKKLRVSVLHFMAS